MWRSPWRQSRLRDSTHPAPTRARKRFGQHFLTDDRVVDAIVRLVDPRPGQHIVEIGPGGGVITRPLVASGAQVHALEIDRDLAAGLAESLGGHANFELTTTDVLKFDWYRLRESAPRWRVVGNLPYNISTPLLLDLVTQAALFDDLTVMVQREVAERLAAEPGGRQYGRLSVMVQHRAEVDVCLEVPPEAFSPPPKVDSSVIRIVPYSPAEQRDTPSGFTELVRAAFGARRKTLGNALRGWLTADELRACDIDPRQRAENLSVADFERLARYRSSQA